MAMTRPVNQKFTPSSGDTVQMPNSDNILTVAIEPSIALTSLTLVWPTNPFPGMLAEITFTQNITTLNHSGGALDKVISTVLAGDTMEYFYNDADSTWCQVGATNNLNNVPRVWLSGVRKTLVKEIATSATVASGNAIFYLTDNGLSSGNAIFTNPYTQSLNLITFDSTNQYQYGTPVFSSGNKILTIPVTRLGLSLGLLTFTSAANGVVVYLQVKGD